MSERLLSTSAPGNGPATPHSARSLIFALVSLAALPLSVASQVTENQSLSAGPTVISQSADAARSGFRVFMELRAARLFAVGDAKRVWDQAGRFGMGGGLAFGAGYETRSLGLSVSAEVMDHGLDSYDGSELTGSALALVGLVYWRPGLIIGPGLSPRFGLGYVRKGVGGVEYNDGQFPITLFVPDYIFPAEAGDVNTVGNGVRLSLAVDRGIWGKRFDVFAEGSMDFVSFQQAGHNSDAMSMSDTGWSKWPSVSLGLAWHP